MAETHVEIRPFLGRREAEVAARAGTLLDGANSKRAAKNLKPINSPTSSSGPGCRSAGGGQRQREADGALPPPSILPLKPPVAPVGGRPRAPLPRRSRLHSPPAVPRSPVNPPRDTGGRRGESLEALKYISSRFL